jgi:hypothetical protein
VGGTSQASVKEILRLGLGYASSALNSIQIVPSYQGALNYDFNQATQAGEFFTHDLEVYFTKDSLASTSWGLKLDALGIFQYQTDPTSGTGAYAPYSIAGMGGPYFRTEVLPKVLLIGEVSGGELKNFTDPNVSPQFQRSGPQEEARLSLRQDTRFQSWNPGAALTLDAAQPTGSEFKYWGLTLQLNDRMFPTPKTTIGFSTDLGMAAYTWRQGTPRYDEILSALVNVIHSFSGNWSLIGSLQGIENLSNIRDTYQYTRFVIAAGIGYTF